MTRKETAFTLIVGVLFCLVVGLLVSMAVTDGGVEPTPTIPPLVVTLDACISRCVEAYEPGTVKHRDCAESCLNTYLESGGELGDE